MSILLCILLFAAGHVLRDGWPSYKAMLAGLVGTRWEWLYHLSTQLARLSGAILCGIGAALVGGSLFGLIVGAAILAGFYVDMKHGEGQGADTWASYSFLMLSGITSMAPLALVLLNPWLLLVSAAKPPVWIIAWAGLRSHQDTWFVPTRVAAGVFGAAIGAAVILVA
jgi:hypothetical protein